MFVIVPPDAAEPVPVTVRPPLPPVPINTIPFAPPFAAILRKFRPEPKRCAGRRRERVRRAGDVDVPPPVAVKALLAPVLAVTPPVRLIVAPVFELRLMPVPVSTIEPLKMVVPPLRFATETECPALPLIGEGG
jgi:hypothetical protein